MDIIGPRRKANLDLLWGGVGFFLQMAEKLVVVISTSGNAPVFSICNLFICFCFCNLQPGFRENYKIYFICFESASTFECLSVCFSHTM